LISIVGVKERIMPRRCVFCESPVPADATLCPVCGEEIAEETLERILPMLKRPESAEVRAMSPIERLWGVIRRPAATFRDIGQRPDPAGPFIIILINALIMAGAYLIISSKFEVTVLLNATAGTYADLSVLATDYSAPFYTATLVSILPNIMVGMIYLIFGSAFAHLAFKVLGGTGKIKSTISIVGYSMFPVVLFRLVGLLIVASLSPIPLDLQSTNLDFIVLDIYQYDIWQTIDYMTMVAVFWVGLLLVFGIREAHDTSTGWAFLISVACMIVLVWTFWQVH
jgi:hypothetical protein